MGWIKKKLRQLDRRVRKIFGSKAWLKIAALVAGTFMGIKGTGGGTPLGSKWTAGTTGPQTKFGQFFSNLTTGLKNVFTFGKGSPAAPTGEEAERRAPRLRDWLSRTASSTATDLAKGYVKEKVDPTFETGEYVPVGSDEASSIYDIAQTAYNNQYGSIDLMDAYRNIDFGTASTTAVDNILPIFMGGNLGSQGISVYKDTSIPISQLT